MSFWLIPVAVPVAQARCGQTATIMNQISYFINWKSVGENFYFGGRGLTNKGDGLIS